MVIVALTVLVRAFYIMTAERSYWNTVKARMKTDSLFIDPTRGSILACNGEQLACNLPEYRIYMDFNAIRESHCDTLWHDSLGHDTKELKLLCQGLHRLFPEKTAEEFLENLNKGFNGKTKSGKRNQHWPILNHRIDYTKYTMVQELPIINVGRHSGFHAEEFKVRNRPYGPMAASVIGSIYKESGKAYSGLELACDSILKGVPGIRHRRKVLNKFINIVDRQAENGADVVTTIDVKMQDLAERALKKEMIKDNAYTGVAIVMEVATGDIKAMVNLDKDSAGNYYEGRNHAVADLLEPGSVFKTASIMTLIEDGFVPDTANCFVDTGNGIKEMYGREMKDHNWQHDGYGRINISRILQVSSNIGVSWLIDKHYKNDPGKFVDGIYRTGLASDLHLPLKVYEVPRIRHPKKDKTGHFWKNWSHTALPWMSIGYETQIPPISTLTFYNAIANNGVMVRPRFVKYVEKNGEVIKEFPVETVKNKICSDRTLGIMQDILYKVVSVGLGKPAGSKSFHVSGKTGTAQIAKGGAYKIGGTSYLLSFAGYFPSGKDKNGKVMTPRYSCIVCIQKRGLPASGGGMSGQVFHDIAEGIMAQNIYYDIKSSKDSASNPIPDVKAGNIYAADFVLSQLGLPVNKSWSGSYSQGNPLWGTAEDKNKTIVLKKMEVMPRGNMPNVIGMGARDAVYILEKYGLKVKLHGRGHVKSQNIPSGTKIKKGQAAVLELS